MKGWALIGLMALGGCATSEEVYGGRTPARELQGVQVAAVRYFAQNYEPADYLGEPKALCVVLGRAEGNRATSAMRISARSEDWDPPTVFLSRLSRVRPRVVPISACVWGDDLSETLKATGERAIALAVDYPQWVTPNLVRFRVMLRENPRKSFSYACSAARDEDGWSIRQCT